jgi:GT2 family glycosyltransferase
MAPSSKQLPLISVVVPSYNQGHFLPDTFESIFRQNYPRLEVIVIDGGSSDGSVDVIRRYESRIKFWRSERDGGQSAAINEGMQHCSGELIAWLNSDDFYWQDCLWTVGKAFATHPGRGLYIGNGLRYDQITRVSIPFNPRHVAMDRQALLHGADFVLQPSTFFLRQAWQRVGGLDERLRFCMDWDIFIRIAELYPCVVINEFLGVSREYDETKTRSGKLERVFEIMRMIRRHTSLDATPGGMLYLLETLSGLGDAEGMTETVRGRLREAFNDLVYGLCQRHGRGIWFPARTDAQDEAYLPLPAPLAAPPEDANDTILPSISVVVTTTSGGAELLETTLKSVHDQGYPAVDVVVAGCGSAGAADGMRRANGQLLVWAEAGDRLADGALLTVGRCFAAESELDVLCGNALHLDERDELFPADHGLFDSGFWIGSLPAPVVSPDFHFDIYKAPRPAVYFRRELLAKCGGPDPSVAHLFADSELFWRLASAGRSLKVERTLALCRVSAATYAADRRQMLADLYRLERPHWPRFTDPQFWRVLRRFIGNYMRWKFPGESYRTFYWVAASLAALSAVTRIGNPMRLITDLYRPETPDRPRSKDPLYWRAWLRFVRCLPRWRFRIRPYPKFHWVAASLAALSAVTRIGNPMRWWPARDLAPGTRVEKFKAAADPVDRSAAA